MQITTSQTLPLALIAPSPLVGGINWTLSNPSLGTIQVFNIPTNALFTSSGNEGTVVVNVTGAIATGPIIASFTIEIVKALAPIECVIQPGTPS